MSTDDKVTAMNLSKRQMASLLADISTLATKARLGLVAGDRRQFNEAMNQLDACMSIAANIIEMPKDES